MSDLQDFERWASEARREHAPRIDVSARVAATLSENVARQLERRTAWFESPLLFAGASLVAATLVAMLALPAWDSVQDPLVAFCRPFSNFLE
jgi:hypothetical protein